MPKDLPLVPIIHIIETPIYGFVVTKHYKFYQFQTLYAIEQIHAALIWLHANHINHFNVSKKTIFYENEKFYLGGYDKICYFKSQYSKEYEYCSLLHNIHRLDLFNHIFNKKQNDIHSIIEFGQLNDIEIIFDNNNQQWKIHFNECLYKINNSRYYNCYNEEDEIFVVKVVFSPNKPYQEFFNYSMIDRPWVLPIIGYFYNEVLHYTIYPKIVLFDLDCTKSLKIKCLQMLYYFNLPYAKSHILFPLNSIFTDGENIYQGGFDKITDGNTKYINKYINTICHSINTREQ